jgi:hypothetical protein
MIPALAKATSCSGEASWWRVVFTVSSFELPETHLFDEGESRLAQFS